MFYLSTDAVLALHRQVVERWGGAPGVRDVGALESAVAQPLMAVGGADLYPTTVEKAAALGFFIISNHPFVDGNKRTGHAAMETMLYLNGYIINAAVDDQEKIILAVAASKMTREEFTAWLSGITVQ